MADGCKVVDENTKQSREKVWSELRDQEKIARMRQMVKHLQNRLAEIQPLVDWAVDAVTNHTHCADGRAVAALFPHLAHREFKSGFTTSPKDSDDVYF